MGENDLGAALLGKQEISIFSIIARKLNYLLREELCLVAYFVYNPAQ